MNKHIYKDVEYSSRNEVLEVNEQVVMNKWEKVIDEEEIVIGRKFFYIDLTPEQLFKKDEAMIRVKTAKIREECFGYINRGKLWYDTLTPSQIEELNSWYQEVLVLPNKPLEYIPVKPNWLN